MHSDLEWVPKRSLQADVVIVQLAPKAPHVVMKYAQDQYYNLLKDGELKTEGIPECY